MGGRDRRPGEELPTVARILMGLIFFTFGLEGATSFGGALVHTGYMFPLIKGTEVVVGALLLANRFVSLALALIAPVIVNILAFHAFLAPSGAGFAVVVLALELHLAWSRRDAYRAMLVVR